MNSNTAITRTLAHGLEIGDAFLTESEGRTVVVTVTSVDTVTNAPYVTITYVMSDGTEGEGMLPSDAVITLA